MPLLAPLLLLLWQEANNFIARHTTPRSAGNSRLMFHAPCSTGTADAFKFGGKQSQKAKDLEQGTPHTGLQEAADQCSRHLAALLQPMQPLRQLLASQGHQKPTDLVAKHTTLRSAGSSRPTFHAPCTTLSNALDSPRPATTTLGTRDRADSSTGKSC